MTLKHEPDVGLLSSHLHQAQVKLFAYTQELKHAQTHAKAQANHEALTALNDLCGPGLATAKRLDALTAREKAKEAEITGVPRHGSVNRNVDSQMDTRELFDKESVRLGRNYGISLLINDWGRWSSDPNLLAYCVREAWHATDLCSVFDDQWRWIWNEVDPTLVMTEEEKSKYALLPDEVVLYRGYCSRRGNTYGLAWTPDEDLAVFFSNYRTKSPAIAKITGKKSDLIYCLIKSRDGWEAICPEIWDIPQLTSYPASSEQD